MFYELQNLRGKSAIHRIRYIASCIEAHANKFPVPDYMLGNAEFLRLLANTLEKES